MSKPLASNFKISTFLLKSEDTDISLTLSRCNDVEPCFVFFSAISTKGKHFCDYLSASPREPELQIRAGTGSEDNSKSIFLTSQGKHIL